MGPAHSLRPANQGRGVSRGRIERLMRRHGVALRRGRRSRVCTTDSSHYLPVAPNLLDRNFIRGAQSCLARRYYLHRDRRRLALPGRIIDLFTRKVVGWAMRDHLCTSSPSPRSHGDPATAAGRGSLHHSDRGGQYAATTTAGAPAGATGSRLDEPQGRLLGQRPDRELLRHPETELVHREYPNRDALARPGSAYIEGFQSSANPLRNRLHHPTAGRGEIRVTRCPLFRGKVTVRRTTVPFFCSTQAWSFLR